MSDKLNTQEVAMLREELEILMNERNGLLKAALTLASEITEKSPAGVSLMKEVINLTESMNLPDGYHVETYATAIITAHPNSKEAAQAFKEKRKPKFEN